MAPISSWEIIRRDLASDLASTRRRFGVPRWDFAPETHLGTRTIRATSHRARHTPSKSFATSANAGRTMRIRRRTRRPDPPPLTADRLRYQRTATQAAPCTPVRSRKHNTTKQTQRTCHESHASARTAQKRPMLTAARIRPPDGRPRNPTRGKTSGPRQPGVARRPSVWPQNPAPIPAPPPRAHLTRIEKSPPS